MQNSKKYEVVATLIQDNKLEVVETDLNGIEAIRLKMEYQMAFGPTWKVTTRVQN